MAVAPRLDPEAVDETGLLKKGTRSAGAQRQCSARRAG
jgi:hypothetical protein